LLPAIDQTRTTGLVVLPGAFVGAVFAGLSPIEAGRFQLVVLASILAAGVVTASILAFAPRATRVERTAPRRSSGESAPQPTGEPAPQPTGEPTPQPTGEPAPRSTGDAP